MKDMVSSMRDMEIIEPIVTLKSVMRPEDKPALEALANEIIK